MKQSTRMICACCAVLYYATAPLHAQQIESQYVAAANQIIATATRDSFAYNRLGQLVDGFGNRFSGSASLERAIDWTLAQMNADGLENVHAEAVMVPHWVRGAESLEMTAPRSAKLPLLGLGGTVATPAGGIEGEVFVVSSFDDLKAHASDVRGKIVLFDVPFTSYGQTVLYRGTGAVEAARLGAIAALLRSVTPYSMRTPHTGSTRYDSTVTRIPYAAVTVEDAMMLHRMQNRGVHPRVRLITSGQFLPDAQSRNVVAEFKGREKPEEIVVVSGHIDSWDVGQGAMDDGGGSVAAWEAVRVLKNLNLRPRRTIRVVLWTNEENGANGGRTYRQQHDAELNKHVLALESDEGVFKPLGFGFTGANESLPVIQSIANLLKSIGATEVLPSGGGTDIAPMMAAGVPGMALNVDGTRYFWYHHTEADTLDKLDPVDVARCAAAIAVMAYVVADLPVALPHVAPAPPAR